MYKRTGILLLFIYNFSFLQNDFTGKFDNEVVVKKILNDEAEETTVKVKFDGTENIFEVNEKINEVIRFNKKASNSNSAGDPCGSG